LTEMRNIYQYSAIILISIILGSSLYMLNNNVEAMEDEDKSGYYVTLEIYQYREGELIDKRVIEDDFILRNLVYSYLLMASGDRSLEAKANYKLIDLNNVAKILKTGFTSAWMFYAGGANPTSIRLGTGTNPVAVTNYKLQTEVLIQDVDDGHIWVSGNQFNVTADSTIVSDDSYSITECGLSVYWHADSGFCTILICRDVFSPIAVNNGDVIMVRYIFRFNV